MSDFSQNQSGSARRWVDTADPPYGVAPPRVDPWEETETAHLRDFLKLSYSERFHLMMQALEFMNMLRPAPPHLEPAEPYSNTTSPRG